MNKQIMEAIDHMTEKGCSADFIARAYPYLIECERENPALQVWDE